jgi:anti-sigma factor RsiW
VTCRDALELVEAVAAGDLEVGGELRAHFETCLRCAAALAAARRVEAALAGELPPSAPPRFTAAVLGRIRRERWRSEQHLDRIFNVAIAVAVLLIAGGVFALLNLAGLVKAGQGAIEIASGAARQLAGHAAPVIETYVAGAALLASAVAMWWWAERQVVSR